MMIVIVMMMNIDHFVPHMCYFVNSVKRCVWSKRYRPDSNKFLPPVESVAMQTILNRLFQPLGKKVRGNIFRMY